MGEWVRGFHVHRGDEGELVRLISSVLESTRFVACGREDFDRAVAVIDTGDWLSVFDSSMYDDVIDKMLSQSLDAPCVALDLMDGDCLQAVLWKKGRRMNTYISDPASMYLTRTKSNSGNAARWRAVAKDVDALQAIFDSDNNGNATLKLHEVAKALAMPDDVALMQYDYLQDFEFDKITYLYFRDTTPKPPIPDVPVFFITAVNMPMLSPYRDYYCVGDKFDGEIQFINEGKVAKGLTVHILGDCLELGCLTLERIRLYKGFVPYERHEGYIRVSSAGEPFAESAPKKVVFQDGRKGYAAYFDDVEIPNSMTYSEYVTVALKNPAKKKDYHPYTLMVSGSIENLIDITSIDIFVHPNENHAAGYVAWSFFESEACL